MRMKLFLQVPENMEAFLPTFADIKTGYTPTQTAETPFKDCSRLENLDTPTPLKHTDFFAYLEQTDSGHSSATSAATTPILQQQRSQQQQQTELLVPPSIKTEESAGHEAAAAAATGRPLLIYDQPEGSRPFAAAQYQMPPYCYAQVPQATCFSLRQQPTYPPAGVAHYELALPIEAAAGPSFTPAPAPAVPPPSAAGSQAAVYTHLQPVRLTVSVEPCVLGGTGASLLEGAEPATNPRRYSVPQSLYESAQSQHPLRQPTAAASAAQFSSTLPHFSSQPQTTAGPSGATAEAPTTSSGLKEKQFVCQIDSCGKRFARVDELKRHQRTHSDYRPYCCDSCNKAFTRSDHLITHKRTHTGEKPYPCPHCDRRFARSDERSRHIKTHTNPSRLQQGRGRRVGAGTSRQPQQQQRQPPHEDQQQPKEDPRGGEGRAGPSTSYSHN